MPALDAPSAFSGEAARTKFLATYDDVLGRLWPAPVDAVDVPTRAGTVRVYRAGPDGGDPVVLLSGAGGNALGWYAYVETLSSSRPVLVVDSLGEPGRSVQVEPIRDAAASAGWLDDVLVGLGAERAHLVGCSYGGWLAVEHERRHPGRVSAVTLVDPAGLQALSGRFYRWVVLGGMASFLPAGLRRRAAARLTNGTLAEDELMRLVKASLGFRRRLPAAGVWTDEELASVRTPVQLLLGARSAVNDAAAVSARIAQAAPSWQTEVVPGTGHALQIEAPATVVDRVLRFRPTRAEPDVPVDSDAPAG